MRKKIMILALVGLGGATLAFAAQFSMKDHVSQYVTGGDCAACHLPGDQSVIPSNETCKKCHDEKFMAEVTFTGLKSHGPLWSLDHGPFALRDYKTCEKCHDEGKLQGAIGCTECHEAGKADEQGDYANAPFNIHRGEFAVSHPIAARTDQQKCARCHENSYCVECHEDFRDEDLSVLSHRKGWSSIAVSGSNHGDFAEDPDSCAGCHPEGSVLPSHNWTRDHAREARRNLATCEVCHPEGDECLTCHSAITGIGVNPHPQGWEDVEGKMDKASGGKTCRKCH
ncbi:cytochrome C [bacterium]|nr:MAG: cytochrome C [bacterium]